MEYKVNKSVCERYDFRFDQWGWAKITIDERDGMFSAQSDYGTYAYSWPHHGRKSFKHFLIEIARDSHYFLKKVSSRTHFDYYKHLKKWKKAIIEARRAGECSTNEAREAWQFLEGLDDYSGSADAVMFRIYESSELQAVGGDEFWYTFDVDKDYPPDAINFVNIVMPALADVLQKEIGVQP